MKRHELLFGMIKVPIESAIVYLAFFVSRDIRRVTDLIPGVHLPLQNITDEHLVWFASAGTLIFLVSFISAGLYRMRTTESRLRQFSNILYASTVWFFLYIGFLFLLNGYVYTVEIPRLIIFYVLFIASVSISLERLLLDLIQTRLLASGYLKKTKIALLCDKIDSDIVDSINETNIYEIAGYFNNAQIEGTRLPYLGGCQDFVKSSSRFGVDEVLNMASGFSPAEIDMIFEYSRIYGIRYKYIANFFDFTKNNIETSFISKLPVVEIRSIGLTPWGRIIKRFADILLSFFGLIILMPLFAIVGIMIKREDPAGPIIYRNKRVGKNGALFDLYKFRYMKWEYSTKEAYGVKPEEDSALRYESDLIKEKSVRQGPLYKIRNDPRKTVIGAFIEKYSIDELPQLFNVLRGEMSLVGPRPHQPREVDLYKDHQKRVLTLKPGITGMAQTHGRHKNSFDEEVRLDIFYIENWSLLLDIKIIFKTIKVVFLRGRRGDSAS